MRRPRLGLPAFFLALAVVAWGCATSAPAPVPAPIGTDPLRVTAEARITPENVFEHIAFLASDEMRGRDTPSPELERVAEYMAAHFEGLGLAPAGDPGSFIQRWPYRSLVLDREESRARATVAGATRDWIYGDEYFAIPAPPVEVTGTPIYVPTPDAFFTGLGISVQGRPLLVGLPDGLGPEFGMVMQGALSAGATGVVLIMDEASDASDIFQLAAALEGGAAGQLPYPVLGLRHDLGMELLQSAGIEPMGARDPPVPLDGVTFSFRSDFRMESHDVPNVVALLPGSDPELSGTYVILTAHFDHVGVGPANADGDSIFSGADDNASGTSVLLQVADALASLPQAPARSVLFLAVSGEEKGLLGSSHYAQSPTVPIGSVVANLNMDMVGRNHPDTLFAIGAEYTSIGERAYRIAAERPELGVTLAPDPEPEEQVFMRSDHFSFVQVGVPALMLTTWLHDEYHQQADTPNLVDADKTARVGRFLFHLTHELATDPTPPAWTPAGELLLRNLPRF